MFSTKLLKVIQVNTILRNRVISQAEPITTMKCQQKRFKSDLYEPDYLISMEPDEPVHDCLNLQLKGYDFALLESVQSQIHRYAEVMGIQVEERIQSSSSILSIVSPRHIVSCSWATPAQNMKVQRFKPGGTAVDAEYHLNVYERNVQVVDVPALALGSLLRICRAVLPEGCTLNVHEHTPEHEEIRYVPDNQLIELQQQLDHMGGSRADIKKKRK